MGLVILCLEQVTVSTCQPKKFVNQKLNRWYQTTFEEHHIIAAENEEKVQLGIICTSIDLQ